MFLDIFIAAIMLASMITGYRMGLIASLLKTVGWIVALVAGVFLHPILYTVLKTKLPIQNMLVTNMKTRLDSGVPIESIGDRFPDLLKGGFENLSFQTTDLWATGIANLVLNIISLIVVVLLIKGIFALISAIASSNDDENVIGFVNSLLGMIFGFIKGFLVISLFFCFLAPINALAGPTIADKINDQFETSKVAGEFYNNNLAMVIFKNFSNDTK